jgi:hypothetical protein
MEEINYKDIKVGEIYILKYETSEYLFKPLKINKRTYDMGAHYIYIQGRSYHNDVGSFTTLQNSDYTFYKASTKQEEWLNYCIRNNNYISMDDLPAKDQDILDLEKLIEESNKYL